MLIVICGSNAPNVGIGPAVFVDGQAKTDDVPMMGETDLNVLMLAAPVIHARQVLGPPLLPANRPLKLHGQYRTEALFGIGGELGSETTAHVWDDGVDRGFLSLVVLASSFLLPWMC